eukprot:6194882-Pleurochrysis_carterae.AAC.1
MPDAVQSRPAGLDLHALVDEMALFMHSATVCGDCNADRMVALATALQWDMKVHERGISYPFPQQQPPLHCLPLWHFRRQCVLPFPPPPLHLLLQVCLFLPLLQLPLQALRYVSSDLAWQQPHFMAARTNPRATAAAFCA